MTERPPLAPLDLPPHPASAPPNAAEPDHTLAPPTGVPIHRPSARRHSQPLSPSPTPLRAPSPIRRPSHPSPDRDRMSRALDMRELRDALPDQPDPGAAPPSPPHTPRMARSRSQPPFFDENYGRRGSLPLATPRPQKPEPHTEPLEVDELAPTVPLDTLRAMAAAGADFAHFPTVAFRPTGGGGKHTVIHRAVPGGVFGPDLAARLVAHLAAEPLLSPWLSPRTSPMLLPLALAPDEDLIPAPAPAPPPASRTHSRPNSISGLPLNPPRTPGAGAPPRTPPPFSLPLAAAAGVGSPTPRRIPEAWWAGAPSVRAAAWSALLDDETDVPTARIVWSPGGAFGIAREGAASPLTQPQRNSFDWSVLTAPTNRPAPKGMHTFAFLPPFDEDEADALRARLRAPSCSPSRDGRSAAPSPETIPRALSPTVSEFSLGPKSVPPSPYLPPEETKSENSASDNNTKDAAVQAATPAPLPQTQAKSASQPVPLPKAPTPAQAQAKSVPPATPPGLASPPTQARRNTLSLFGLSPRKPRK